jgi:hypothetical protein
MFGRIVIPPGYNEESRGFCGRRQALEGSTRQTKQEQHLTVSARTFRIQGKNLRVVDFLPAFTKRRTPTLIAGWERLSTCYTPQPNPERESVF